MNMEKIGLILENCSYIKLHRSDLFVATKITNISLMRRTNTYASKNYLYCDASY